MPSSVRSKKLKSLHPKVQHLCIVQQLLFQAQHLCNRSWIKRSICATAPISSAAFVQQLLYQEQHLCNSSYFKCSICATALILSAAFVQCATAPISSAAFVQQLMDEVPHLCNSFCMHHRIFTTTFLQSPLNVHKTEFSPQQLHYTSCITPVAPLHFYHRVCMHQISHHG